MLIGTLALAIRAVLTFDLDGFHLVLGESYGSYLIKFTGFIIYNYDLSAKSIKQTTNDFPFAVNPLNYV